MDAILVINAGSSTIKFCVFSITKGELRKEYQGIVDCIATAPVFTVEVMHGGEQVTEEIVAENKDANYEHAIERIINWTQQKKFKLIAAGHRIVHGGLKYSAPVVLNENILEKLATLIPLMPLHQPYNLEAVKILQKKLPNLLQVGCFDTAFHTTCNPISQHFALPKYMTDAGVRRYGFHGLSYEYIASQLANYMTEKEANGKFVVAHLGNGASMCGIKNGKSVAISIGFTALDGLPMSTRCGAIDPGAVLYLMDTYNLSTTEMWDVLYKKSGLLGISGISSDMRDLLATDSPDAKLAVDIFVHRISIFTGQLAAELQGIDGFVFTAGIGEHAAIIREKVAKLLGWLGVIIDKDKNQQCYGNAKKISAANSKIPVLVIPTDEELIIARHTGKFCFINY